MFLLAFPSVGLVLDRCFFAPNGKHEKRGRLPEFAGAGESLVGAFDALQ